MSGLTRNQAHNAQASRQVGKEVDNHWLPLVCTSCCKDQHRKPSASSPTRITYGTCGHGSKDQQAICIYTVHVQQSCLFRRPGDLLFGTGIKDGRTCMWLTCTAVVRTKHGYCWFGGWWNKKWSGILYQIESGCRLLSGNRDLLHYFCCNPPHVNSLFLWNGCGGPFHLLARGNQVPKLQVSCFLVLPEQRCTLTRFHCFIFPFHGVVPHPCWALRTISLRCDQQHGVLVVALPTPGVQQGSKGGVHTRYA